MSNLTLKERFIDMREIFKNDTKIIRGIRNCENGLFVQSPLEVNLIQELTRIAGLNSMNPPGSKLRVSTLDFFLAKTI